jgi:hypothetical protein
MSKTMSTTVIKPSEGPAVSLGGMGVVFKVITTELVR